MVALVMETNVQIVNGKSYQLDKVNTKNVIEPYSPINIEPYGMLSKILFLTILVIFLTMVYFHRDFFKEKIHRAKMWIKHCFVMKKIPQRKLENRIRQLEEEVENQKASLELQKSGFLQEIAALEIEKSELEEQMRGLQEETTFYVQTVANMQTAINTYHRERNELRVRLAAVEQGRFDVIVTRHGTHWHRSAECQFLRNSENLKILHPCAGCT